MIKEGRYQSMEHLSKNDFLKYLVSMESEEALDETWECKVTEHILSCPKCGRIYADLMAKRKALERYEAVFYSDSRIIFLATYQRATTLSERFQIKSSEAFSRGYYEADQKAMGSNQSGVIDIAPGVTLMIDEEELRLIMTQKAHDKYEVSILGEGFRSVPKHEFISEWKEFHYHISYEENLNRLEIRER